MVEKLAEYHENERLKLLAAEDAPEEVASYSLEMDTAGEDGEIDTTQDGEVNISLDHGDNTAVTQLEITKQ